MNNISTFYNKTSQNKDFKYYYENFWEAKKIVDMYVEDAIRDVPEIIGPSEQILKKITKNLARLNFFEKLRKALILERRDGGAVIFIGYNDKFPLKQPPPLGANIEYIKVVEAGNVSTPDENQFNTQLLKNDSFEYLLLGNEREKVHIKRLIVFDGGFVKNNSWKSDSVLKPLIADIERANLGRECLAHLLKKSNYTIILDKSGAYGMLNNDKKQQELDNIAQNLNIDSTAIISSQDVDIVENAINFGALPEIQINNLKILAAASNTQVSKFVGITNSGLSNTNDGDLENYYNVVSSYQKMFVVPKIYQMVIALLISYGGMSEQDIETLLDKDELIIQYPSLWNKSEEEEESIKNSTVDRVLKVLESGLMTPKDAVKILNDYEIFPQKINLDYEVNDEDALS